VILLGRGPWAVGGRGVVDGGGRRDGGSGPWNGNSPAPRPTPHGLPTAYGLPPTALKPVRRLFRAVLVECVREIPHDRIHTLTLDLPPLHHPDQLPVAQDGH